MIRIAQDKGIFGMVVGYFLFISLMLFFTPFFDANAFNVQESDLQGVSETGIEAGIFVVALNFINDLIIRFSVLFSISITYPAIGVFIGAWTVASTLVLARLIAEALP